MPADKKVVGLSVGVGLATAGLIGVLVYFLTRPAKTCPTCPTCPPCQCYAESVSPWTQTSSART